MACALDITIALKIALSIDTTVKYKGCHFEQIAAARARNFERVLKRNATFAANTKTAATRLEVTAGRTMLPLVPKNPLMHSEWKTLLRKVSRHTQQMAVKMDAAKAWGLAGMFAKVAISTVMKRLGNRLQSLLILAFRIDRHLFNCALQEAKASTASAKAAPEQA